MNRPDQETITQIAVIVRDMEKALDHYTSVFGIDRPETHLTGPAEESQVRFRGEPTPVAPNSPSSASATSPWSSSSPWTGPACGASFSSHTEGAFTTSPFR